MFSALKRCIFLSTLLIALLPIIDEFFVSLFLKLKVHALHDTSITKRPTATTSCGFESTTAITFGERYRREKLDTTSNAHDDSNGLFSNTKYLIFVVVAATLISLAMCAACICFICNSGYCLKNAAADAAKAKPGEAASLFLPDAVALQKMRKASLPVEVARVTRPQPFSAREFSKGYKGPLVIQVVQHPALQHHLDKDQPPMQTFKDEVVFDTGANEVYEIGSGIEVLKHDEMKSTVSLKEKNEIAKSFISPALTKTPKKTCLPVDKTQQDTSEGNGGLKSRRNQVPIKLLIRTNTEGATTQTIPTNSKTMGDTTAKDIGELSSKPPKSNNLIDKKR